MVLAIPHKHIPRRLVHPDAVRPRHRSRLEAADAFLRRGCELGGRDAAHPVDGAGGQVDATDRVRLLTQQTQGSAPMLRTAVSDSPHRMFRAALISCSWQWQAAHRVDHKDFVVTQRDPFWSGQVGVFRRAVVAGGAGVAGASDVVGGAGGAVEPPDLREQLWSASGHCRSRSRSRSRSRKRSRSRSRSRSMSRRQEQEQEAEQEAEQGAEQGAEKEASGMIWITTGSL